MAITKDKKIEIVKKVGEIGSLGGSMVFVNFHGLTVAGINTLRRNLQAQGLGYYVAKKTLIKRALADRAIEGQLPELAGEVGIAFAMAQSEADPLLPVKEVYDFHKKNAEVIKIIGGVFEGAYASAEMMLSLAKIPGRQVLYAQFLNVINSPIQGLVIGLDAIAKKKEGAVS
ncbi:MAG: 50S ribosomal protein L10 [Candidatus Vogelbacteria bacterium CG10_big_fil_rev_8_21_14_0_10_49_38]|uniref:Large ribosomal subunit protein uL10 n=1 Tax=Candidatus Vogelbacteria bacterium CG10_big_fil_rev_8_21_14_0_10_49_38 TaxID=1975043 RepID=A0A2H0RIX8_9BACT|nr:MAG: 50S ribosomal protein L10 [bacterium CG10_49_38]PIR46443.1 MAG: 50S ribosomal protein L10 [Candidatus Vogelbacteria bacterium CG10_big_fil_rev_8_21_14_0_10_49_38]